MEGLGSLLLLVGLIGARAASPAPGATPPLPPPARTSAFSAITIRARMILRVPARRPLRSTSMWKEKKGPRCMALDQIDGAAVMEGGAVDFILDGGTRLRAHFERSCPALDFYSGFYLRPSADGQICAGRDELRDRTGNACGIDRLRLLVADPGAKPDH